MVENAILEKALLWIALSLQRRGAKDAAAIVKRLMAAATLMAAPNTNIETAKSQLTAALDAAGDDADELLRRLEMCFTFSNAGDRRLLVGMIQEHGIILPDNNPTADNTPTDNPTADNPTAKELIRLASLLFETPHRSDGNEWNFFYNQHRRTGTQHRRTGARAVCRKAGDCVIAWLQNATVKCGVFFCSWTEDLGGFLRDWCPRLFRAPAAQAPAPPALAPPAQAAPVQAAPAPAAPAPPTAPVNVVKSPGSTVIVSANLGKSADEEKVEIQPPNDPDH